MIDFGNRGCDEDDLGAAQAFEDLMPRCPRCGARMPDERAREDEDAGPVLAWRCARCGEEWVDAGEAWCPEGCLETKGEAEG